MVATQEALSVQYREGAEAKKEGKATTAGLMRFALSCARTPQDAALVRAWLAGYESR